MIFSCRDCILSGSSIIALLLNPILSYTTTAFTFTNLKPAARHPLLLSSRRRRSSSITSLMSTTSRNNNNGDDTMILRTRYFERLGFSQQEAGIIQEEGPNKANLDKIIEAHLDKITFDNLSQHGFAMSATLDVEQTAHKILDCGRGGFCFELNNLLGELLIELGFRVKKIPAIVHVPGIEFQHLASHMILVVDVPDAIKEGEEEESWLVDVGFGEPAINSLQYVLDMEQSTPDGMTSRIVKDKDDSNCVILEWMKENPDDGGTSWSPRLKWEFTHPGHESMNNEFQLGLAEVLKDESVFGQKLIVCKINRKEKISLAGNKLKRTSPRFGTESTATVEELETTQQVHKALREIFGVPDPTSLDLERSFQAEPALWTQF